MKVKKYIAKDMSEAMAKIRTELGQDAVILNSKRVETGGFLGFFTSKNIEVIAAIDHQVHPRPKQNGLSKSRKNSNASQSVHTTNKKETDKLSSEILELKNMIKGIKEKPTNLGDDYPLILDRFNNLFLDQELDDSYRLEVMKHLLRRWYRENGEAREDNEIEAWTKEALRTLIADCNFGSFQYNKKYLNVVGPTGVGKTTTIAKIAAKAALYDKKKVAFITTDTFRIAAIEQLKTYAKILNVPVEVAYSIKDFQEALDLLQDYDFILVDSAGRNFRNPLYVEQLKQVIDFNEEMETHLVLAMTSKYRDMKRIIDQFQLINIDRFIFTKLDETDSIGTMVNVMADYKIGSSYITSGQNVPDDIEEATSDKVIQRLIRR